MPNRIIEHCLLKLLRNIYDRLQDTIFFVCKYCTFCVVFLHLILFPPFTFIPRIQIIRHAIRQAYVPEWHRGRHGFT